MADLTATTQKTSATKIKIRKVINNIMHDWDLTKPEQIATKLINMYSAEGGKVEVTRFTSGLADGFIKSYEQHKQQLIQGEKFAIRHGRDNTFLTNFTELLKILEQITKKLLQQGEGYSVIKEQLEAAFIRTYRTLQQDANLQSQVILPEPTLQMKAAIATINTVVAKLLAERKFFKLLETYKELTDDVARSELFKKILGKHDNDDSLEGKQFKLLLDNEIARLTRIISNASLEAEAEIEKIRGSYPSAFDQLQAMYAAACQSGQIFRAHSVEMTSSRVAGTISLGRLPAVAQASEVVAQVAASSSGSPASSADEMSYVNKICQGRTLAEKVTVLEREIQSLSQVGASIAGFDEDQLEVIIVKLKQQLKHSMQAIAKVRQHIEQLSLEQLEPTARLKAITTEIAKIAEQTDEVNITISKQLKEMQNLLTIAIEKAKSSWSTFQGLHQQESLPEILAAIAREFNSSESYENQLVKQAYQELLTSKQQQYEQFKQQAEQLFAEFQRQRATQVELWEITAVEEFYKNAQEHLEVDLEPLVVRYYNNLLAIALAKEQQQYQLASAAVAQYIAKLAEQLPVERLASIEVEMAAKQVNAPLQTYLLQQEQQILIEAIAKATRRFYRSEFMLTCYKHDLASCSWELDQEQLQAEIETAIAAVDILSFVNIAEQQHYRYLLQNWQETLLPILKNAIIWFNDFKIGGNDGDIPFVNRLQSIDEQLTGIAADVPSSIYQGFLLNSAKQQIQVCLEKVATSFGAVIQGVQLHQIEAMIEIMQEPAGQMALTELLIARRAAALSANVTVDPARVAEARDVARASIVEEQSQGVSMKEAATAHSRTTSEHEHKHKHKQKKSHKSKP